VSAHPSVIAAGPDGNMWFTGFQSGKIGKITMNGVITIYPLASSNSRPTGIVAGPDGALWFTEGDKNKIGRVTTGGTFSEYLLPPASDFPYQITVGGDGALWFTEINANKIGRITTAGDITDFTIPTNKAGPNGIAAGPDGAIWFTEYDSNKIGRLGPVAPSGPSPLVASILPTSRSVQVGNVATAFATIINTGVTSLKNCRIAPNTYVTGFFSYQTTNPQTNALSGTPNAAITIPPGGLQTYVFAYRAGAAYTPKDVQLNFICEGTSPATPIVGINTLLLTFDTNPVADMIAVGVTPSNDGFSRTNGPSGIGLFAVATSNVGAAATLTATARLTDSTTPLSVTSWLS